MSEVGGATNQAGIYYQNCVAAMQLLELLDLRSVPARERVVAVRVEAPGDVDDIVVEYADGHRHFLSAKMSIRASGDAWDNMWADLRAEVAAATTRPDDQISIIVAERSTASDTVASLCTIALTSIDAAEFDGRLTETQRRILSKIGPTSTSLVDRYELLRRIEVIVHSEAEIEHAFASRRNEAISVAPATLLALLRDMAGGHARTRQSFRAPLLRRRLREEHGIAILEPSEWGVEAYRSASRRAARIEIPGTGLSGPAVDVILWPRVRDWERAGRSDFEDELPLEYVEPVEAQVDLRRFPAEDLHRCVLIAGPGHGKSALLSAIAAGLADGPIVPALIPLASLAASGSNVADFLTDHVDRSFDVKIGWRRLAEQGLVALLLDGLDEVPGAARAPLLEKLRTFSARYPEVPWLLTVRDPAVLTGANEARMLEILPLNDNDIVRFAKKMATHGLAVDGDDLVSRLRSYPDLKRLARIPLFLALMIATLDPEKGLPTSRSELIDRYLQTLFAPHEHKPLDEPPVSPITLRAIASYLAFARLEAGEIGASERQIATAAAQIVSPEQAERMVAALVTNGIVRRQSNIRFQFPFPIIQEYLAASYLIDHAPDSLARRIDDAIQRPWAQVLQFALELHPKPSPIVAAILARPDDAFATGLRLVARCIANGAKVDEAQVAEVTERLVEFWIHAHHDARDRVGQLIFDAFSQPISTSLRAALHHHWLLNSHGAEIIAREASDELTMSILEGLLHRKIHQFSLYHPLKAPMSALGDAGFERIMTASRADDLSDEEWSGLNDLLTHFAASSVSRDKVTAMVADTRLPLDVRLNCARIAGRPLLLETWDLLIDGVASGEIRSWRATSLLAELDGREDRFFAFIKNDRIPFQSRFDLVSYLARVFPSDEERDAAIARLTQDTSIDPDLANVGRLLAARYGDRAAFEELVEDIPTLTTQLVHQTLGLFGHYPGAALATRAAELVSTRSASGEDIASFASGADIGMRYVYEMDWGFGGSLRETVPHAGTPVWADLLTRWLERNDLTDSQRMDVASHAAKLGSERARSALVALVLAIGDPDDPCYDDGNGFGQTMRTAVNETRRFHGQIPLDLAERLARAKRPNVPYAGVAAIEGHGDRRALDLLLKLHRDTKDWSDRSTIEGAIEKLASKLSIFVRKDGRTLDIAL